MLMVIGDNPKNFKELKDGKKSLKDLKHPQRFEGHYDPQRFESNISTIVMLIHSFVFRKVLYHCCADGKKSLEDPKHPQRFEDGYNFDHFIDWLKLNISEYDVDEEAMINIMKKDRNGQSTNQITPLSGT